jgi:hypothetical protein
MFLFEWSKISEKGIRRLSDYIEYEMQIPLDSIFFLDSTDKSIALYLAISGDEEPIPASISKNSGKLYINFGKNSDVTNILDIKERNGRTYVFGQKIRSRQSKTK